MGYYVGVGSTVRYKDDLGENEVKLVDVKNLEGEVSVSVPLGNALLGASVGERRNVEADEPYEIEILEIKDGTSTNTKKEKELEERDLKNRDRLFAGKHYGTNSKEVYKMFCNTLGWDKNQINKFGRQGTPLFAESADADRCRDVWFLSHINDYKGEIEDVLKYNNIETLDVADGGGARNFIDRGRTTIVEFIFKEKWLKQTNNKERITFAKTKESCKYEFLGVYELVDKIGDDSFSRRVYKLKSKEYPIDLLEENKKN